MQARHSAGLWIVALALAACGDTASHVDGNGAGTDGGSGATSGVDTSPDAGAQEDAGNPPPQTPDAGTLAGGLPCDVADLMRTRCLSCHGHPTAGGAPMSLVTYAELKAPTPSDPTKTAAQESLLRMKNPARLMPPGQQLPQSEIDVLQRWVDSGSQPATCDGTPDAGTPEAPDAGSPPPPPPADPLPDHGNVCTSKITWLLGDLKSQFMHPGKACITCHAGNGGPDFTAAGTLYPSLHEPDDCFGTGTPKVEITDATGKTFSLSANLAGNFNTTDPMQFPIRAKVLANGNTREMLGAVSTGDCNSCHTQSGSQSAPGRIVSP